MSDAVLVTIISVVVGGIFTIVFKIIDSKTSEAKEQLDKNTAEVEAMAKVLEGMQVLANNLRTDYDRERQRADRLEKDLIEEKSINVALSKQNEEWKKNEI